MSRFIGQLQLGKKNISWGIRTSFQTNRSLSICVDTIQFLVSIHSTFLQKFFQIKNSIRVNTKLLIDFYSQRRTLDEWENSRKVQGLYLTQKGRRQRDRESSEWRRQSSVWRTSSALWLTEGRRLIRQTIELDNHNEKHRENRQIIISKKDSFNSKNIKNSISSRPKDKITWQNAINLQRLSIVAGMTNEKLMKNSMNFVISSLVQNSHWGNCIKTVPFFRRQ